MIRCCVCRNRRLPPTAIRITPRRGVILIVVLVGLLVVGAMMVSVTRRAMLGHQSLQAAQRRLQAQWLLEAGIERAMARLAADLAYGGETWSLGPAAFEGQHDAEVRIKAQPVAGRPGRLSLHIEADYPRAAPWRCRAAKQLEIDRQALAPSTAAKPVP